MKSFLLICLTAGLASTEKLDRTYLPPPGSKFSGGSPGDIQVPLEFPKENYLTGQSRLQDGIPKLELGINRRPKPVGSTQSSTQKPFSYLQHHVPTTTTSYVITQTTTFAPPVDYHGRESSSLLNATGASKQPGTGQIYQQQPNQGQSDNTPQYNQQSLIPYGSTTQRPRFESNRKPVPYLPPAPSGYKGQSSSYIPPSNYNFGYLSAQTQGPSYQDGQQSSIFGQGINQSDFTSPQVNQQNQFARNVDIPSSTAVTQYQDESFGPTNRPDVNQQGFGYSLPTQQNVYQLTEQPRFPTSTTGPEPQDKIRLTTPESVEHNQYIQSQNFPASTLAPQYLGGQRIISPGSNLQSISSTTSPVYEASKNVVASGPQQYHLQPNQYNYREKQNFPTSTAAPQYHNGQPFTTPGSLNQNQYLGNQNTLSTVTPPYQDGQQFVKPGTPQETIAPNQQVFGSRIPNQKNTDQYPGNRNFPSSTAVPQSQNGQQFTTSGLDQSNQYFENQNIPSAAFPQYQDSQHILTPGVSQKFAPNQLLFGSRVPTQQNQIQFIDGIGITTPDSIQLSSSDPAQNQYQYQGRQNYPSSTTGSVPSQQITDQNVPTNRPHFQNAQRINIPGAQKQFLKQQYPSTAAPQYQSTFSPSPGLNQQVISSANQYSPQPHYTQSFPPSTSSPQKIISESQVTNGNGGIQNIPDTITSSQQELISQGFFSSSPDYNLSTSSTTVSPFPIRGSPITESDLVNQERPERPQAASDRTADILGYESVLTPEGYSYSYDTSNGIHADETGIVDDGTKAQGGFSYTGDDGKVYSVFYSADENGFQPRGDHLPTPPPIPEAIQRVIEQANKDRESGISDDGSYNEEMYGYMKYDGKLTQLRQKNKTLSVENGGDIADTYENIIGTQKKKQFISETGNDTSLESTDQNNNEEEQVINTKLDDGNMKIKEKVNRRILNKRPTNVQNPTVETMKTKSMNRNNFNRHPVFEKENQEENKSGDGLITDVSDGEDLDDESDVVIYRDDPNFRTDFRGTNKYLPNPKKTYKFNKLNRRPVLANNAKPLAKGTTQRKPNKPNFHNSQPQTIVYENEEQLNVNNYARNSSRNNKTSKKAKGQPKFGQLDDTSNNEKSTDYNDNDYIDTNGESESHDAILSMKSNRRNKPVISQYENKRLSEQKIPKKKDNDTKIVTDEESGYEYNPPQRNFNSEEEINFPTRTSKPSQPQLMMQKGSQETTIRPFMTPNVYGDEDEAIDEDSIEFHNNSKPLRPLRPLPSQKDTYPVAGKESLKYNENVAPVVPKDRQFDSNRQSTGTTRSEHPLGRPQSSPALEHHKKNTTGPSKLNIPSSHHSDNKVFNNSNAPSKGISNVENDAFVSTTPRPHLGSKLNNEYQQPGLYQTSIRPTDDSRLFENNTLGNKAIVRGPGTNNGSRLPSTTYRPNYTFGQRTLAPSGSIVDGFGRLIPSTAPQVIGDISKNESGSVENNFRPGVGLFGVTSAPTQGPGIYQGSTAPIGEDFSGPKHPQGFDTETGYYYK